jgi:lipopolysaccharide transport system permease protein
MALLSYLRSTRDLLANLSAHRRLAWALAKRDMSDEHVGQSFGVGWAIVQPLLMMGIYLFVFTFVFATRLEDAPNPHLDYSVYLFSGLIPWLTLSLVLGRAPTIVVNNTGLVKQVALPVEILPIKALFGPFVFFCVVATFSVFYALVSSGGQLALTTLLLPALTLLLFMLAVGLSLLLSCLGAFFRDIREIVNVFLNAGLFILPILYKPGWLPPALAWVISLNPFSAVIWSWQDALYYGSFAHPGAWVANIVLSVLALTVGARIFMAAKDHFGDVL